jgi:hypothetical protein
MAESTRRQQARSASPWRWIVTGAILLALAILGVRLVPTQQPKATNSEVRIITVTPVPVSAPPRKFEPFTPVPTQPVATQPSSTADTAPAQSETRSPATIADGAPDAGTTAVAPADPAPAITPVVSASPRALNPAIEQGLRARMHALDPDNAGLSREQLIRAFPRAGERFDEIDTNHDGRVTASELIAGWTRIATFPQQ